MLNHVHCMCNVHFNVPLDLLHCFIFSEQLHGKKKTGKIFNAENSRFEIIVIKNLKLTTDSFFFTQKRKKVY